jgi:glutamate synthase domain-containing protein 1
VTAVWESMTASRCWMRQVRGSATVQAQEAEGGCGVVGLASTVPVAGRHILTPLQQMHNRGNGKGGGIAAVGLSPEQMGVTREILDEDYLVQIAYLDPSVRQALESEFIDPNYKVDAKLKVDAITDKKYVAGLEVTPPEVWRYFCRAKDQVLDEFVKRNRLSKLDRRKAEDEFVYQTSFRINKEYYAGKEMTAFVMSHGRNMVVMKIVGYAEDVIRYYKL